MAGMITRCPKCATAFRISDAHLKSAKGMVRCGNCLHVFNARDNIQNAQDNIQNAQGHSQNVQDHSQNTKDSIRNTTQVTRDTLLGKGTNTNKTVKPEAPPTTPIGSATSAKNAQGGSLPSAAQRATWQAAPSPTQSKSKGSDAATKATKPVTTQKTAPSESLFDHKQPEEFESHYEADEDDEAWALELLKDDSDLNIKLKKIVTPEDKKDRRTATNRTSYAAKTQATAHETRAEQDEPHTIRKPKKTEPSIQDMLAAIEPEALEVNWESDAAQRKKRLIWTGLSLVACLILIAQVAWLEFYRLSTIEPYRTGYAFVCPIIGCTLPELKNIQAIETSNLVIRSHPNTPNALMVDVILQNNANFEQQFPNILLTFSDLENKTIAARRFAPGEYLGGELAGVSHMPIKQPIHIAIEIQDPGTNALSYNIAVVH